HGVGEFARFARRRTPGLKPYSNRSSRYVRGQRPPVIAPLPPQPGQPHVRRAGPGKRKKTNCSKGKSDRVNHHGGSSRIVGTTTPAALSRARNAMAPAATPVIRDQTKAASAS